MGIIDLEKHYVLENLRVRLKPLMLLDVHNLSDIATKEQGLWKYTLHDVSSKEKLLSYIEEAIVNRQKGISYAFSVIDKKLQKYAGCTRIYEIDTLNKTCSIGYTWYGKNFQGTGINKNCKYLLFEFAFEELLMERIQFRVDKENSRSINAIKSLGCQEEGILRSNLYKSNGERRDSMILSMLKSEWTMSAKTRLEEKLNS